MTDPTTPQAWAIRSTTPNPDGRACPRQYLWKVEVLTPQRPQPLGAQSRPLLQFSRHRGELGRSDPRSRTTPHPATES